MKCHKPFKIKGALWIHKNWCNQVLSEKFQNKITFSRSSIDEIACSIVVNTAGFNLMTRDSYFTILVEVFTNHILAKNTFHESYRLTRT